MLHYKTNRIALYASSFFLIILILFAIFRDNSKSITLNDARIILQEKTVINVVATKKYMYLRTENDVFKIPTSQIDSNMFAAYKVEVESGSNIIIFILFSLLFFALATYGFRFWQKNQNKDIPTQRKTDLGIQEVNQKITPMTSDVSFSDIGGISDVKIELEEIIDFMKNPVRYKNFGARMPRGVLLVGPPGVGKTMIAKAVAKEAGVPFFYQSGASFVQIYVGMGAKRVHELFQAAKNNAPSIIFIDEIDAVGKKRDGQRNDEREATLNQLLTEMDGFEGSSGVIVVAATNKIDVLDSALLRAGRFDRRIFVELPTKRERQSILSKYLVKVPHEVDVKSVANMTVGFSGASLAALVNEAALLSIRQHDFQVTIEHFHQVKDKVMFGKKKLQILSDEQKKYKVTYQTGKVVCATYFDFSFEKLMLSNEKLTPSIDKALIRYELEARVKMHLAGMVACSLKYGQHDSSAKDDLKDAKELILHMLNDYGMGKNLMKSTNEEDALMSKLHKECEVLLKSMQEVMQNVETVFHERESISKLEVKKYIDAVL